jgi:hypothetical protein
MGCKAARMVYHGVKVERDEDADQTAELVVCVGRGGFDRGLVLLFSDGFWDAIFTLPRRGGASKGRDFAHTTRIITDAVYGLVPHPLYLGWLVMYLSLMCFSQHWAALLLGGVGVVSMVMIARQEDQALIEKFGEPYRQYRSAVPGLNLLVEIYRKIFRGRPFTLLGCRLHNFV